MRLRHPSAVVLLVCLACGDGASPIVPSSITIVSGDDQSGALGDPLAEPLRVLVRGSDNNPLAGAIVKAVKTHAPELRGLPVIQPAETAGCC